MRAWFGPQRSAPPWSPSAHSTRLCFPPRKSSSKTTSSLSSHPMNGRRSAHHAPSPQAPNGPSGPACPAAKTISTSYEQPYVKHAPIGPFVAVADVHDGTATVWSHSANSQGLRAQIANTLSLSTDKVVVRWMDHAGQFGRTTFGGDGAEGDAAILSQLTGKPVRVQWTLQEDLAWSASSPGWVADMRCGLNAENKIGAIHSAFYSPQSNDARIVGAILAGMPCSKPKAANWIATEWAYDKIEHRFEEAYGIPNLGADTSAVGLRGLIMRTPGQRQQNFA